VKDNMSNPEKRLRIGVLFGGRSGEHEVSLASAASVIRGLDPGKYEPIPIGITKEGQWCGRATNAAKGNCPWRPTGRDDGRPD
jgi:D-alanine-D-alanine ligase-like ATP-grasp enzyme